MSPARWQQIAQLFEEVMEHGPDERAAALEAACAADAELRCEVETLLAARDGAGDFLNQPALALEARREAALQITLPPGQQLAHFEILAPLGAGAMGEVYLARDTRLERKVALKLLPVRFTQDASRLRRFEREARAASSLNHQNIITVYEVGQDGARHYIAAEFVEGVTLRQRLAAGPLSLPEALDIASQIAAALEAAHQAGIVHRDIKPENVMVRPDGVVKVLDFGIAKLTEQAASSLPVSRGTEQGTVIGTPGYMSPEQARGLDVDARTDIFSLGVVLYEMIAGELPFRGTTSADAIVALLELEPARLSSYNARVSPALDKLITKLLAKERGERYATAAELQRDLQSCQPTGNRFGIAWRKVKQRVTGLIGAPAHARPRLAKSARNNRLLLAASGLSVCGLALLGWLFYQSSQPVEIWADRAQLNITPFISKKIGFSGGLSLPAFSPDGKAVAYSLGEEANSHLWVKTIATETETRITTGQWKDFEPIWSPDGQRLAFFSNRAGGLRDLWSVELAQPKAGQMTLLKKLDLTVSSPRLIGWAKTRQGERFYLEIEHNLFTLDPVSAVLQPVTKLQKSSQVARFSLSPKLDQVIYLDQIAGEYCLLMKSLLTGETTVLLQGQAAYRSPVWFPDGRKVAFCSDRTGTYQVYVLWLADRRQEQVTFSNDSYDALTISPDGNTIAASVSLENANLFALNPGAKFEAQHTSARGLQVLPEIAPGGDRLIFQAVNTTVQNDSTIFIKSTKPDEPATRLTAGFRGRWAPNGAAVAFLRGPTNNAELWRVNPDSKEEQRLAYGLLFAPHLQRPYNLAYAEYSWSPDSAKLAYDSQKSGQSNLWQVTADGGQESRLTDNTDALTTLYAPHWAPQPGKLVYLSNTRPEKVAAPTRWRLHLLEAGQSSVLLERDSILRILGWAAAGQELLLAARGARFGEPIELLRLNISKRQERSLGLVSDAYLNSLTLVNDGGSLAFSARRNGLDNLELVSLLAGRSSALTSNFDPASRYAALTWAPVLRRLFYSKQEYRQEVQLIVKKPVG